MTMITCTAYGKAISNRSADCVNCGVPVVAMLSGAPQGEAAEARTTQITVARRHIRSSMLNVRTFSQ